MSFDKQYFFAGELFRIHRLILYTLSKPCKRQWLHIAIRAGIVAKMLVKQDGFHLPSLLVD